jgi:hypothetical protein
VAPETALDNYGGVLKGLGLSQLLEASELEALPSSPYELEGLDPGLALCEELYPLEVHTVKGLNARGGLLEPLIEHEQLYEPLDLLGIALDHVLGVQLAVRVLCSQVAHEGPLPSDLLVCPPHDLQLPLLLNVGLVLALGLSLYGAQSRLVLFGLYS